MAAVQGDRLGAQGEGRALPARRARRGARPRRGLPRSVRRDCTTRSTTRGCTSSRSTTSRGPARASATRSSTGWRPISRKRPGRVAGRGPRAPAALRPLPDWDWDDEGRRAGDRHPLAAATTSPSSTATSTRSTTGRPGRSRTTRRARSSSRCRPRAPCRRRGPLPWDAASPDHGLGWRSITERNRAQAIEEVAFR